MSATSTASAGFGGNGILVEVLAEVFFGGWIGIDLHKLFQLEQHLQFLVEGQHEGDHEPGRDRGSDEDGRDRAFRGRHRAECSPVAHGAAGQIRR